MSEGILAMKVVWGTVSGDEFRDSIQRELLPTLMPFDGPIALSFWTTVPFTMYWELHP